MSDIYLQSSFNLTVDLVIQKCQDRINAIEQERLKKTSKYINSYFQKHNKGILKFIRRITDILDKIFRIPTEEWSFETARKEIDYEINQGNFKHLYYMRNIVYYNSEDLETLQQILSAAKIAKENKNETMTITVQDWYIIE